MSVDIFNGIGVQVDIKSPDNFLKIKETLSRIGIAAKEDRKLYQSCHILHKRNSLGESKYAIVHFKEMFKLDGKSTSISDTDLERRNFIVGLLTQWGLLSALETININDAINVKIISHKDKANWELVSKYNIGKKRNEN